MAVIRFKAPLPTDAALIVADTQAQAPALTDDIEVVKVVVEAEDLQKALPPPVLRALLLMKYLNDDNDEETRIAIAAVSIA